MPHVSNAEQEHFRRSLQDYIGKQDSCESLKAMREDSFTAVHMVFTVRK